MIDTVTLDRDEKVNNEHSDAIASLVAQIQAIRHRAKSSIIIYASIAGLTLVARFFVMILARHNYFLQVVCIILQCIASLGLTFAAYRVRQRILTLEMQLVGSEDVRALGYVLEANQSYPRDKALLKTLLHLLSQVKASDARHISAGQRSILCSKLDWESASRNYSSLHYNDYKKIAFAILEALEQIGDEQCIPAVKKLIAITRDEELRAAAKTTLPYLLQRAEEQRAAQGLLRPADNTATPDVLLRPAVETADAPDHLLHASTNENSP